MRNRMRNHISGLALCVLLQLLGAAAAVGQGVWTPGDSIGFIQRSSFCADTLGGQIVVVGGGGYQYDSLQSLNTVTHKWTTISASGKYNAGSGCAAAVMMGKLYVIGGYANYAASTGGGFVDTSFVYDPTGSRWAELPGKGPFTPREYLTANVIDSKIYTIGGDAPYLHGNVDTLNFFELFDPFTNTWTKPVTNGSLAGRTYHTSAVVDGKIYVIGGRLNIPGEAVVQVFDPSTNTWTSLNSSGFTVRTGLTSSVVDGKIYAIGGSLPQSVVLRTNIVEVYDPKTDSWSTPHTTGKFTPRRAMQSVVIGKKIYVLGGAGEHEDLKTVEVLDPYGVQAVESNSSTSGFSIYPNPTNGVVRLSSIPESVQSLKITNILGEVIFDIKPKLGSSMDVDLSKFSRGIYCLQLATPRGLEVRKIIRE